MTDALLARDSVETIIEGDPDVRLARQSVEVLVLNPPPPARLARDSAEAVVASPATAARLARLGAEVLIVRQTYFEGYATEQAFSVVPSDESDSATSHIVSSGRVATDDLSGLTDAASTTTFFARTASDTAPALDSASSPATRPRTAADSVPVPTDLATATVQHIFYRFGVENLAPPADRVQALTRPSSFSQPAGGRVLLKRVLPNEPRSYLTRTNTWASDVAVSRPVPYSAAQPVLVDMGGFGFTTGGITVNLSEADEEAAFAPYFAPETDS